MSSWWHLTLAELAQILAVGGGLILVWWQIRQASRAIQLQALSAVLTELGSANMRKLRSELLGRPVEPREVGARTVAVALDRVGYMSRQKLLPDTVFTDLLEGVIEELWKKRLQVTVKEVREQTERKGYCKCLVWLVEKKLPKIRAKKQGDCEENLPVR